MQKPGIALIGCGNWGRNHLRVWSSLGCLKLVCDNDRDRLNDIKAKYSNIDISSDINEVLKRDDISAVVIATPTSTHTEFALKTLKAGKDVFVEKPLALTVEEGKKILQAARQNGLILMVGHILEYHPAFIKLQSLIKAGEVGRLRYIYSHRLNLGRIRTEENALWSLAPHDISVILRIMGLMPEKVMCHGGAYVNANIPDVTHTILDFPDSVQAHIFVSWLHPFKEHRFVVVGEKQMVVLDDTLPWPEKLVIYPHSVKWVNGQVPVENKSKAIPVPLEEGEPLKLECEHFLECINKRKEPLTDAQSAVAVLQVLEKAQESLERNIDSLSSSREGIHYTAIVDAGANIGKGTKIWHYSHVMPSAKIGENCILGQNVFVGSKVTIGSGVKIQNNISIYEGVELEDNVFCGPSVVFTNVINPRSEIERKDEFRKTLIKKGATLGANCTIICGVTVGKYALIGAGAVVTKDVPDFALVTGVPAHSAGWVCICGNKLKFSNEDASCEVCSKQY